MIVDIHTHTFPVKIAEKALNHLQGNSHTALFSDGTEEGLRKNEKKAGVDLAVVQPVATYPEQVESINNRVIRGFGDNSPAGMLSFAAMHPLFSGWEGELERIAAAGIPGIKLHPPYEQADADDPRMVRILKKCRELGLIILMHSGWDVGLPGHSEALPGKIRNALDAAGDVKLIAAHMAGWKCWEEAAKLLAGTGIYLDTAFALGRMSPAGDRYEWKPEDLQMLTANEFCGLVRVFGSDHVLFGTDSPWTDPAEELRNIRTLPLAEPDIQAICGENAARLLSLSEKTGAGQ